MLISERILVLVQLDRLPGTGEYNEQVKAEELAGGQETVSITVSNSLAGPRKNAELGGPRERGIGFHMFLLTETNALVRVS